jgi:hypothetical protein
MVTVNISPVSFPSLFVIFIFTSWSFIQPEKILAGATFDADGKVSKDPEFCKSTSYPKLVEMVNALGTEPAYVVFFLAYADAEGNPKDKTVCIKYCPENVPIISLLCIASFFKFLFLYCLLFNDFYYEYIWYFVFALQAPIKKKMLCGSAFMEFVKACNLPKNLQVCLLSYFFVSSHLFDFIWEGKLCYDY